MKEPPIDNIAWGHLLDLANRSFECRQFVKDNPDPELEAHFAQFRKPNKTSKEDVDKLFYLLNITEHLTLEEKVKVGDMLRDVYER